MTAQLCPLSCTAAGAMTTRVIVALALATFFRPLYSAATVTSAGSAASAAGAFNAGGVHNRRLVLEEAGGVGHDDAAVRPDDMSRR